MFYKLAYPGVARAVSRMYKTTDRAAIERTLKQFGAAMDAADARLAQQPYLDGEQPGRADITLGALLGPLAQPAEHPMTLVATTPMPPEVRNFVDQYVERPAIAHVRKLYREHRFRGARYRLGPVGAHLTA
jgi:glutathione S-transferase